MEKSMINKGVIFYENGTWSFVTKIVNCNTYTIEYEKKRDSPLLKRQSSHKSRKTNDIKTRLDELKV